MKVNPPLKSLSVSGNRKKNRAFYTSRRCKNRIITSKLNSDFQCILYRVYIILKISEIVRISRLFRTNKVPIMTQGQESSASSNRAGAEIQRWGGSHRSRCDLEQVGVRVVRIGQGQDEGSTGGQQSYEEECLKVAFGVNSSVTKHCAQTLVSSDHANASLADLLAAAVSELGHDGVDKANKQGMGSSFVGYGVNELLLLLDELLKLLPDKVRRLNTWTWI